MWNLAPPPGFEGLRPDKPLTVYLRHLPHWRQEGATYFVTFRLHDSLPQSKLHELDAFHREWEQRNPPPYSDKQLDDLARETMRRVERWLDQGMGSCCLKDFVAAKVVVDAMHHFDGERYELGCYVVMPNHVHSVLRPLPVGRFFKSSQAAGRFEKPSYYELERILQSWKRHSSRQINRQLGLCGHLWQDESFDRIIRNEEHLWQSIQYIGDNPRRAGLPLEQCPIWIRPEWVELGWRFRWMEIAG